MLWDFDASSNMTLWWLSANAILNYKQDTNMQDDVCFAGSHCPREANAGIEM